MGEWLQVGPTGNRAYQAVPETGAGAGVLVLHAWWGLTSVFTDVCDRLAAEGFTALAPDLYHGDYAEHTEMDKASELMNSLPPDRAARDMGGAIDYLLAHDAVRGGGVGVMGFCMGGMLTLLISALQGNKVAAAVPFYGAPLGEMAPDWSGLTAPVLGHFAEKDDFFPPDAVRQLEAQLKEMGKEVTFHFYPDCGHGFANEEDPLNTHDAEATVEAWDHSLKFLRSKLR